MLEYPNGAPGYLTVSTVEMGVKPRLQIVGERGTLELSGNQLTIHRLTPSSREHLRTSTEMFGTPAVNSETLDLEDTSGGERAVYRDLVAAIAQESSAPRRWPRRPDVAGAGQRHHPLIPHRPAGHAAAGPHSV